MASGPYQEAQTQVSTGPTQPVALVAILEHLGAVDGELVCRGRPAALVSREAGQTRLFPGLR